MGGSSTSFVANLWRLPSTGGSSPELLPTMQMLVVFVVCHVPRYYVGDVFFLVACCSCARAIAIAKRLSG